MAKKKIAPGYYDKKKKTPMNATGGPRLNLIKEVLEARGMSQQDLAHAAKLGFGSVNMYYHGKREPSLDTLVKIARALDVSPRELIIDHIPIETLTLIVIPPALK